MSSDAFDPEQPPQPQPVEDWAARIGELLEQAEGAPAGPERAGILCRISEIYERRLGDPNEALVTLQTALADDPASGRVIQEMERLARGHGIWGELAAVTAEVAGGLEDRKQAADLWVQIAFWNETGRAMLDEATKAAETALTLEPAHGGALALLENLYRRQRSWERYVEILGLRRDRPGADAAKLADSYREVLRYEPRQAGALDGLARLHEEAGEWDDAADALRRLVAALPDGLPRIEAQYRLAKLLKERLRDPRGAEEQLALLLTLPDGQAHVPSQLLLAALYRERKDWLKARQLLGRAAAAVTDVGDKTRLLGEAAEICATALDDEAQAADLYAEILALDTTRSDLVEKLAEIKLRRGDFSGLLPLAELLAGAAAGEPAAERARRHHRLGRAREATGDEAGAVEAYRAAALAEESAPAPSEATLAARRDLADLTFRREAWGEAAAAYASVLADPAALSRDAQLVAYERLGIARVRAGAPADAIEPLEKALALDPRRSRVLETLVEAARAAGNDDAVVRHTQGLLAVTDDPKTKLGLLEHVAIIHHERRHDPQRAIAAYLEALTIWPDERSIMHRLLELYTETKQWKQSVQVLARLAELTDSATRGPYFVAAGNILAEELSAPAEAIEAFEQALDTDPGDAQSFARIEQLTTEAHDWKTQERAYRRQIKRLGTDPPPEKRAELVRLWHGLGEIYRTRLKDGPAALAAFEVAASLDPDSLERRRVLAELYRLAGPPTYAKAVAEHRALVAQAKTLAEMVPDLKALVRLCIELGRLDEAHGAAAALVVIGPADADERALFAQYRPTGVVRAHARLTEEVWQKQIYHPDEDRGLSQILATLAPAVAAARARPFKETSLKKKRRRELASDTSLPCKVLTYGAAVLGVTAPDVYLDPDAPGEVDVVNVRGTVAGVTGLPALVLGTGVAEMRSDIELAFVVGRALAALRPDHLLRWPSYVPTLGELEIVAHAAIRLVSPEAEVPAEQAAAVTQYAAFLDRALLPQLREQLTLLVRRFQAAGHVPDTGRWSRAACLTTIRAGLLLCGDLEVSARLGQAAYPMIDSSEIVRDLCAWSVSEGYFELRAQLGLRTVNLDFRG
ncbi:MAG TPA: tetratricopeptide repeat protein [Polyangia bacterium]|jgi:tetratricopeptide (TPR) repeat protein